MCIYNDSDALKIWPLSSPLSSKMEIIAITTVLQYLLQGASEDYFVKKGQ